MSGKKEEILIQILSNLYGQKKVQILQYMVKNMSEDGHFFGTIKDICEAVDVSKPTVVSLFNDMKCVHLLKKEKNGLYSLNSKLLTVKKK